MTKIEWTDETWNPTAGCDIISPGCTYCYAMRTAARLAKIGKTKAKYEGTTRQSGGRAKWTGRVNLDYPSLQKPHEWKTSRRVFVDSMSDLFHEAIPLDFLTLVFQVMVETPRHTYQILTKRPENLERLADKLPWPANVWMGVSVESADYVWRIDNLRRTPPAVRFLSLEPLLGPLDGLDLSGIHWAIGGGESGPGARPMRAEWMRSIRDQCIAAGVPFFCKQFGTWESNPTPRDLELDPKAKGGATLDGRLWREWPTRRR